MKLKLILLIFFPFLAIAQNKPQSFNQYKEDFNFFWNTLNEEYCYFNLKHTDWQKVKEIYSPMMDTITTREQFVTALEKVFNEIYDHHASLNTNNPQSQRLVPSGSDIWAEYIDGKAIITEVRDKYGCDLAGIQAGMEVLAVNDVPVQEAIKAFMAKSLSSADNEDKSYALRILLAGNHIQARKFKLKLKENIKDYYPDKPTSLLENRIKLPLVESYIKDDIAYIKINDCLYDYDLITQFDSIMNLMQGSKSLILDLRNTPSGGNTIVARAILGWFINKDHYFQKHEYYAEEKAFGIKRSWLEIVSPRKDKYYSKPMAILVNHWTGSVSEALTIAFDGFNRPNTKIIGTTLARLRGAGNTFEMPNTKIRFTFPIERLYHVNGMPREEFVPNIYMDMINERYPKDSDIFITKAIQYFKSL